MKALAKSRRNGGHPPGQPGGLRRWPVANFADPAFKQSLKETLAELLTENPRIMRDAIADAWEDSPPAQAEFLRWVKEGDSSERVGEDAIFKILRRGR